MADRFTFDAKVLSLSDTNDIYMEAEVLFLTDQYNLNGVRFTGSFINSVVENSGVYQGIPLVVDMHNLESKRYDKLTHKLTADGLGTQVIGAFVNFYTRNLEDGALALLGTARIYKRFPATCSAILDLYTKNLLKFSVEALVGEYKLNDNGTKEVPASESNVLIGVAIVSNPAEPRSQAYYLVAEALLKDQEVNRVEPVDAQKKIKIDNSADSASDVAWGDVDKIALRNAIMEADNAAELVKEAYLIVEDGWQDAPSEHLKYPHHVIQGDTLVVAIKGCQAAYQRLMQNDPNNQAALDHLRKHYKELGLDMAEKQTTQKGASDVDIAELQKRIEELEAELAQCKNDIATKDAIIAEKEANIVSLGEAIAAKDAEIASLNEFKVKYEQIMAEKAEAEKQAKKAALMEKISKFFSEEELKKDEIVQAIEAVDENAVNKLIADKVVAEVQNKTKKNLISRITDTITVNSNADIISKYITTKCI